MGRTDASESSDGHCRPPRVELSHLFSLEDRHANREQDWPLRHVVGRRACRHRPGPGASHRGARTPPVKHPVAAGTAAPSCPTPSSPPQAGLDVLRHGGTAADAAVAVAATLGVTDPYVAGHRWRRLLRLLRRAHPPGLHHRRPRDHAARADENACSSTRPPGKPYAFPTAVTSGLSASACPACSPPGSARCERWGELQPRGQPASPAIAGRRTGASSVDATFREQTRENAGAVRAVRLHRRTVPARRAAAGGRLDPAQPGPRRHLPADRPPGRPARSTAARVGRDVVDTVQQPAARAEGATLDPLPGLMTARSTCAPTARSTAGPTHVQLPRLRRLRHGAVLQRRHHRRRVAEHPRAASTWPGMDRGAGAAPLPGGEPARVRRPRPLHRRPGATWTCRSRRCCPTQFAQAARLPDRPDPGAAPARSRPATRTRRPGSCTPAPARPRRTATRATTPTTSWSATGGATSSPTRTPSSSSAAAAIVVPGRGFLLNNELTDFNFAPTQGTARRPEPACAGQAAAVEHVADDRAQGRQAVPRGRFAGRRHDHHDRAADPGQPHRPRHDRCREAIAAPRASQRNATTTQVEPAFLALPTTAGSAGARPSVRDHVTPASLDPTIKISPDIGVRVRP